MICADNTKNLLHIFIKEFYGRTIKRNPNYLDFIVLAFRVLVNHFS